jgi:hypothetical protein
MSLRWRTATLGLIFATATLSIVSLSAQTSDPLAGTWELNLGKSKFSPGPPPKSETRTYDVTGQQEKNDCERNGCRGEADAHPVHGYP